MTNIEIGKNKISKYKKPYETDPIKDFRSILKSEYIGVTQVHGSNGISCSEGQRVQDKKEVTDCGGVRMRMKR